MNTVAALDQITIEARNFGAWGVNVSPSQRRRRTDHEKALVALVVRTRTDDNQGGWLIT